MEDRMRTYLKTGLALAILPGAVMAGPACVGQSPAHTVALVELYTSEGCSSCPPADRFFGGLRPAGVAPSQAVLLALHVDYWNYIGWKDPFSRKAFTERQRWLSDLAGTRTIYTPEFFVGGHEQRDWSGGLQGSIGKINKLPARAGIAMSLGALGAAGLPVDVVANSPMGGTLHVALVEDALTVDVKTGENGGRTLHHEHVVREWLEPVALGRDGKANVSRTVAVPSGARATNLGVAAFVQSDKGEVLQAFSLQACR
jgi:hypothetical protein